MRRGSKPRRRRTRERNRIVVRARHVQDALHGYTLAVDRSAIACLFYFRCSGTWLRRPLPLTAEIRLSKTSSSI